MAPTSSPSRSYLTSLVSRPIFSAAINELALSHGDDRDVHLDVAGLEPPVEVALEDLADFVDQAALDPAVDK